MKELLEAFLLGTKELDYVSVKEFHIEDCYCKVHYFTDESKTTWYQEKETINIWEVLAFVASKK